MSSKIFKHGGNIREAVEEYHILAEKITDFSANINPLGPPTEIKNLICDNIDVLRHYPDSECKAFKRELAQRLNVNPGNLLIGNGSVDLIYLICRALRPKRVLIPVPTFSEYEGAARSAGARCAFIENEEGEAEDFRVNLKKCLKLLSKVNLVFLCNPNNPTGHLLNKGEMLSFVEACKRHNVMVVVDEAFIDFVENGERLTLVKEAGFRENLLVLRSLTKLFALPGLRIGYMLGSEEAIKLTRASQAPWSVNAFAQLAGRELIKNFAYIKRSKAYLFRERQSLYRELKKLEGIRPYLPTANFIFCNLASDKITSTRLCHTLGTKGILVRDCANFRGLNNGFVRIAVRKKEENKILIKALKELLDDARS